MNPITTQKVEKVLTAIIVFVGFLFALQMFGVDIFPLLTFSGIGAAILGFASKDFVSNFYGGLMIYINRPFEINDSIEMPSKNIEGIVEEIGWYLTTIRDMQKRELYIPNSFFNTETIINHSRITHRRIDEVLRFTMNDVDKLEKFLKEARQVLSAHPEIDQNEPMDLFLVSIGPYGSAIAVKAYTRTKDYLMFMKVKEEILFKIYRASTEPKF